MRLIRQRRKAIVLGLALLMLIMTGCLAVIKSALVEHVSEKAENVFMQAAIHEAMEGIARKQGGPFGSVVVRDGKIVGRGHNRVLSDNDPTCHGEVAAIRAAGKKLGNYDLTGCVLYTTGEPCPMCLFACKWANIERVYYGCTVADNERIGFRDKEFEDFYVNRDAFGDYLVCIDREACLELFDAYLHMDRKSY